MVSNTNRTPARQAPPKAHRRVRVVCISDTHELHRDLALPDGDLLIHAGDFTFWNHAAKIQDFNDWLGELPHRHKVVVPGNHDRAFSQDPQFRAMITNAVLLVNERVTLCGLNVWGSPVTCDDTAFGYTNPEERARLYATIPDDIDILITHGPPYGILDHEPGTGERQGCPELRKAVVRVTPRLHVFGHVHVGYRVEPQGRCGGFRIDFVIEGREGRRIAVECDGDRFHGPGQWGEDMTRQRVLERAGWTFWRCFASSFRRRRTAVLEYLFTTMANLGIEPIGSEGVDNSVWVYSKEVDPYTTTSPLPVAVEASTVDSRTGVNH